MSVFKRLFTLFSLFSALVLSTGCVAADLVVSDKLVVTYTEPKLMAHTSNSLIVKYSNWWFSHEVVDGERMYPGIDLSDQLPAFIRSIFDADLRKSLTPELSLLSKEQAKAFGVAEDNVKREKRGPAEMMAVYDAKSKRGDIYVIEERLIHHVELSGSAKEFAELMSNIKER